MYFRRKLLSVESGLWICSRESRLYDLYESLIRGISVAVSRKRHSYTNPIAKVNKHLTRSYEIVELPL